MAAKKSITRTTSDQTQKRRQARAAQTESKAAESPVQDGLPPAEPVESPAISMPEMPAAAESASEAEVPPDQTSKANKLSALDAAAKVLGESGQAMSCAELIAAMAAKGYWSSPKGRTPASTLYSAVLRELQTKGDQARFRKTERGKFTLRETV